MKKTQINALGALYGLMRGGGFEPPNGLTDKISQ